MAQRAPKTSPFMSLSKLSQAGAPPSRFPRQSASSGPRSLLNRGNGHSIILFITGNLEWNFPSRECAQGSRGPPPALAFNVVLTSILCYNSVMRPTLPKGHDKSPEDVPHSFLDAPQAGLHRVVCWMGIHDFELIEVNLSFIPGCGIEKVQCRHCGIVMVQASS